MFKNKIWVEKSFQTAINIAYDLYSDDKIEKFIPTSSSINFIEEIMFSTHINSVNRANILVGAYGKGKSHIVLVIMGLIMKKDKSLFDNILNKIKQQNKQLHTYLDKYLKDSKKILPIIINGNNLSLTSSFLLALEQSLKRENLLDLMPDTNFQSAIDTILLWKDSYKDTYQSFQKLIPTTVDEFIISLRQFDIKSYNKFNEIYPKLTSGSTFNPFYNVDIIELYENVVYKLKKYNYEGIYVIYDEFSKYLEANIDDASVTDIKLLQDFAEKCNRSGKNQMHLMLISHKDIDNYIDKNLDKQKVDGWRGVSGRFNHICLSDNFSQTYEVISSVIKKDNKFFNKLLQENKKYFEDEKNNAFNLNMIKDEKNILDTMLKGCYPMHIVSTFILPILSEKIAQNERTSFTFLSSNNKYTLNYYLEKSDKEAPLLTPDYIYDYFVPLLRKEIYTSNIYKIYNTTNTVLRKLEKDSLSSKIIKTIALIYIIEQFERLAPTKDAIINIYAYKNISIEQVEKAIEGLIKDDCIIHLKKSNGFLKIKQTSNIDVLKEISTEIKKNVDIISLGKILNDCCFENYIYPTAYNDEIEIIRYFDFKFIESDEFLNISNWDNELEKTKSVGIVYGVILKDKSDLAKIKAKIQKNTNNRLMFIIPKVYTEIEKIAYEYYSAISLKKDAIDNEILCEEYDIIIQDLEEVISNFINCYTKPEKKSSSYFYMGNECDFKRKAQISAKLSEICYDLYKYTPIINNEMINKDEITTQALNSRNKAINAILRGEIKQNLGLIGSGQDVSFIRSTLIRTGILIQNDNSISINIKPDDKNMCRLLTLIRNFFIESSNGQNFKKLYDTLILPENGYGIKRGVIPIYIALILNEFKTYAVIREKDIEMQITLDLLNSVNKSPEKFTIYIENWDNSKDKYINHLQDIYINYVSKKEKEINTFSYIVSAMTRWYMSLPKYAKEMTYIYRGNDKESIKLESSQIKFINSLKKIDINARQYLFEQLPKIFKENMIDEIEKTKNILDNAKQNLIYYLIEDTKRILSNNYTKQASLCSIIKDYIDTLKPQTISHIFVEGESRIITMMTQIGNDDVSFIQNLGRNITNLRIDDWDLNTVKLFVDKLNEFKETVSNFNENADDKTDEVHKNINGYTLTFLNEKNENITKTFDKIECSGRGRLLQNEISTSLEEMGEAISEGEKIQILMSFIEKMC